MNFNALRERCMGQEPLVRKLIAIFLSSGRDDLHALLLAAHASNLAQARSRAHRIAGGAAIVGADELTSAARRIEHGVISHDALDNLHDAWRRFEQHAAAWGTPDAPSYPPS